MQKMYFKLRAPSTTAKFRTFRKFSNSKQKSIKLIIEKKSHGLSPAAQDNPCSNLKSFFPCAATEHIVFQMKDLTYLLGTCTLFNLNQELEFQVTAAGENNSYKDILCIFPIEFKFSRIYLSLFLYCIYLSLRQ